jgi:hypothetical protein
MTPYERASELISAWKRGDACGEPGLVTLVTTALQAQSNEDELRHREKQQALRDLLAEQAKRADAALAERDALRASESRLREALEKCRARLDYLQSFVGWSPANPAGFQTDTDAVIALADAALATPAEGWLEEKIAQAKTEAVTECIELAQQRYAELKGGRG